MVRKMPQSAAQETAAVKDAKSLRALRQAIDKAALAPLRIRAKEIAPLRAIRSEGSGRPSKYTQATVVKILEAVAGGSTYRLAAGAAGITYDTLNEWRKAKPDFSDALEEAEGIGADFMLAMIKAHGHDDWRAFAFILERRHPTEYGKQVTEMQGSGGGPLTIIIGQREDGPQ